MNRRNLVFSLLLVSLLSFAFTPVTTRAQSTIADIVVSSCQTSGEFCTLLAAVQAADPAVLALLSNPGVNLTVFAPTNAAFSALLARLGITADELLANKQLVTQVLTYHVLTSARNSTSLIATSQSSWPDQCIDTALTIDGVPQPLEFTLDTDTYDGTPSLIVNFSTVQAADIAASNGIVHVIDQVLLFGPDVISFCGR
ncbi:MAG: fasciclin domain-containing protein [Anaerolineae bacterium]|nr:fasciclin domain-containing protein [Anaerolineae bacterium]